ncbi:OsmC family protein [Agrilactobacillus fermenti]|uniref:OsmC family protein n=1 Tax=Agrilactobacillus fermenti TaxID=2586909 RepID=UPI001E2FEE55|nr:OsmC family protein [Agrilactobacillus fermenti]MCD2256123.1 OsmC family protein [Agrilactobacillus fermenti]
MSVYHVTSKLLAEGAQVLTTAGSHQYLTDEPVTSNGTDKAPNPVQYLLGSLGTCLAITVRSQARKRHIEVTSFEVTVTGNLEMGGLRDSSIHNQFTAITYHVQMKTNLTPAAQNDFLADCVALCPVHGTLEVAVPITEN